MKKTLVAVFWLILGSAAYTDNYNWNYLDIELNDDGAGSSPNASLSSHVGNNGFVRASLLHVEHDDIDVDGQFSLYTAGYRKSSHYLEAGFVRLKLCQQFCETDFGPVFMLGATQVGKNFNTKIAFGKMDISNQYWTVLEAHATYKITNELDLYLSFTDLDYIGDRTTNFGFRLNW